MKFHNKVIHIFSQLFLKSDKYVVIELLDHYIQVTVLRTDFKTKQIAITRAFYKEIPEFNAVSALKEARQILKKISGLKKYKIILSLDSSFATTMYSSVSLIRTNPKDVIDEADLDNLISQAIWRFFDKHRFKVAQKLNVDEVDVLLTDVRIRDIQIDGHRVVNPIGFKSKSVEIFFSQTFVTREFMRELRDALPKENLVLMMEAGTALSHVLSHARGDSDFYIANLFPGHTAVFAASNRKFGHHDSFDWGGDDLKTFLGRYFRLDSGTADLVIFNYMRKNASGNFTRKFETMLAQELNVFANGIESLVGNEPAEVYVNPFFNMPEVVFSERFQNRFEKPVKLLSLSTNLITEKLGYKIQYKASAEVRNPLMMIGAVLELTLLPQNDTMSHLANRRVRWLVT